MSWSLSILAPKCRFCRQSLLPFINTAYRCSHCEIKHQLEKVQFECSSFFSILGIILSYTKNNTSFSFVQHESENGRIYVYVKQDNHTWILTKYFDLEIEITPTNFKNKVDTLLLLSDV